MYSRGDYALCIVRAVSAALRTSNWGAHAVTGGPKFSPVTTSPPERASIPKLKYEALEISEVSGPLKEKFLCITVTLGHFESNLTLQLLLRTL